MQAAGNDGERIAQPDLRFHQTVISASGNRLFSSLAQVVGTAIVLIVYWAAGQFCSGRGVIGLVLDAASIL